MPINKRDLMLGNQPYELSVRQEQGGYFGDWFCHTCRRGGVKYDLLPSAKDAFSQARAGAERHQAEKHISN